MPDDEGRAAWKAALAARHKQRRRQRATARPKPITGLRIPPPDDDEMTLAEQTTRRLQDAGLDDDAALDSIRDWNQRAADRTTP